MNLFKKLFTRKNIQASANLDTNGINDLLDNESESVRLVETNYKTEEPAERVFSDVSESSDPVVEKPKKPKTAAKKTVAKKTPVKKVPSKKVSPKKP